MNLAEIRKKAQKGEAPAEQPAAVKAPAPEAKETAQAAAPAAPPQAAPPAPGADESPEPPAFEWLSEQTDHLLPVEYREEDQDRFDPAAVILRGRETSSVDDLLALTPETAASSATLELLCFKVASEEYAISIMAIKEIIKPREVTEVPRVPSFVRGILSLRGVIIPIFDMRERLGLPDAAHSERERVIVVNRQSGLCGVLVDEVVQVVRIAQGGIEPPPVVLEGIDRDFVQGIGRVDGRMLILLDMEKVLDVSLT